MFLVGEAGLGRREAPVIRGSAERVEATVGVLRRERPPPVGPLLLDREAAGQVEDARELSLGALENRRQRIQPSDLAAGVAGGRREVERARSAGGDPQVGGHIDAVGLRVQAVGEELHSSDRETSIPQNPLRHRIDVAAEGRAEQDAVVDLDVEVVNREVEVVRRREREPPAQVHGGFFLQRFGAEELRRRIVHREVADLDELAAGKVRRGVAEEALAQAGGAESRAHRTPQNKLLRRLEAERQLPGQPRSKVAVVLEAPRDIG